MGSSSIKPNNSKRGNSSSFCCIRECTVLLDFNLAYNMDIRCFTFALILAATAANVDSTMRRDEDLEGIVNKLLYRSEFPMKIEDKRGWEPITFQRQRLALSKRGWEALPLYRRRNFHHKRAWESPMVKFGKRTNLFPFVDTYRFSDSVGPSCCSGDLSAGCCRFCESRISVPLLLDPSIKTQEPCQCCDMSEEFCTMCSVLK